jgi:DNA gyrase subunit B
MGNQQSYLENDSQLEDLLVRERFSGLEVEARGGAAVKLTEARYNRLQRGLTEFEGWSARLRSDYGPVPADFVVGYGLVETDAASPHDAASALAARDHDGYTLETEATGADLRVRLVETETSAASDVVVPAELFASPIYDRVRKTYARLTEIVGGPPPFSLRLGKQEEAALTFSGLRDVSLSLARHGIQITRFKGLSEMNPPELWATTMDPARRMLIRVNVEDAAAADLWFSRLMGDEVEPRREFIEQNALDVRFLDV